MFSMPDAAPVVSKNTNELKTGDVHTPRGGFDAVRPSKMRIYDENGLTFQNDRVLGEVREGCAFYLFIRALNGA